MTTHRHHRTSRSVALLGAAVLAPLVLLAGPARAADPDPAATYRIAFSPGSVGARSGPALDFDRRGAGLPDGTAVTVACEQTGRAVSNVYGGRTDLWDRLDDGRWVPNAFLDTGADGRTPGVPTCGPRPATIASWALAHVTAPTGAGADTDCTWFVSHALWAGGLPMSSTWTSSLSSLAAVNVQALVDTLVAQGLATSTPVAWTDRTAGHARVGDLIAYDWGRGTVDGLDHVAVVTTIDAKGRPHVSQHSPAQRNRLWSFSRLDQRPIADDPAFTDPVAHVVRLTGAGTPAS